MKGKFIISLREDSKGSMRGRLQEDELLSFLPDPSESGTSKANIMKMDFNSRTQGWATAHSTNLISNRIKASRRKTFGNSKGVDCFLYVPPKRLTTETGVPLPCPTQQHSLDWLTIQTENQTYRRKDQTEEWTGTGTKGLNGSKVSGDKSRLKEEGESLHQCFSELCKKYITYSNPKY